MLTTLIHFCFPSGKAAFDGLFKFEINESRIIRNSRDERVFDWQDDGKDFDLSEMKFTHPGTTVKVDPKLIKEYFYQMGFTPIEYLADSKAIDQTIANELKQRDEIDDLHAEQDREMMEETYRSLQSQFI